MVLLLSACNQTATPQKEAVLDTSYFLSLATKTEEFKSIVNLLKGSNNSLDLDSAELVEYGNRGDKDSSWHLIIFDEKHDYMFTFDFDKESNSISSTYLTKVLLDKKASTVSSFDVNLQSLKMVTTVYNKASKHVTKGYSVSKKSLVELLELDYSKIDLSEENLINTLDVECWDEYNDLLEAEDEASRLWRAYHASYYESLATAGSLGILCGYSGGIACATLIVIPFMANRLSAMEDDARAADRRVFYKRDAYYSCLNGD